MTVSLKLLCMLGFLKLKPSIWMFIRLSPVRLILLPQAEKCGEMGKERSQKKKGER